MLGGVVTGELYFAHAENDGSMTPEQVALYSTLRGYR